MQLKLYGRVFKFERGTDAAFVVADLEADLAIAREIIEQFETMAFFCVGVAEDEKFKEHSRVVLKKVQAFREIARNKADPEAVKAGYDLVQLRSAAREMLDALKFVRELSDHDFPDCKEGFCPRCVVENAIAKAGGRS